MKMNNTYKKEFIIVLISFIITNIIWFSSITYFLDVECVTSCIPSLFSKG